MTEAWPLSSFDHMMVADDRPDYPMVFWLRLTVRGVVDEPRLTSSVRQAVARHPLFGSRLVGDPGGPTSGLRWERDPELLPRIVVAPTAPRDVPRLDPAQEAPVRLFVQQGASESVWLVQVHHAASDGLGAVSFVEDVFAAYTGGTSLKPLDASGLLSRPDYRLAPGERRHRLGIDLVRTLAYLRRRPAPVRGVEEEKKGGLSRGGSAPTPPSAVLLELPEAELAALRYASKDVGGTINDLLLTDLFLTLDAWNRRAGAPRRPLRVAMPLSMRLAADVSLPAANVVSMCFLDRAGAQLDDPAALARSVAKETRVLKEKRLGHALLLVTDLAGRVRGGMRSLMAGRPPFPACAASAVLSNLGEPCRRAVGGAGLTLDRVELLPPLRPGTGLAVGVVTYGGRLALTLHHDPRVLDAAAARILADDLARRLGDRVAAVADRATPAGLEDGPLLERLIAEHTAKRQSAAAFRSLPIGRHVALEPVFEAKALPAPEASDLRAGASAAPRLRHQNAHEVRGADHSA